MLRFPRIEKVKAFPRGNVGVGDCVLHKQANDSQFAGRLMAYPHDLSRRARLWWYDGVMTSVLPAHRQVIPPSHVRCHGRRGIWSIVRRNLVQGNWM